MMVFKRFLSNSHNMMCVSDTTLIIANLMKLSLQFIN